MNGRVAHLVLASVAAGLVVVVIPNSASGQLGGIGSTNGGTASSPSNPFANSYSNPFLNPYAAALSQQPMDTGTMALYFMAARQAGGGIGSGRLSGTRPSPGASSKERGIADDKKLESSNVPGAMASRYFNRTTPVFHGTQRYYNRQARYFPPNGQSR